MRPPSSAWLIAACLVLVPAADGAEAAAPAAAPGVVSHVKVLSDKVPDVSSLEAWKQSFLKDGMSDKDKALAVWKTVVMFQHQDAPPLEYLEVENTVMDPIRMFNVYGYSLCGVATSHVLALARYAGLEGQGWTINRHCVPDLKFDGTWHLLDASLINYFPKADGSPAGVEEIVAGLKTWYEKNPDYKGNDGKLREFMRAGGWRKGPEVLSRCPFYDDNGWLPAATHGWYSTMQEYDGSTLFAYESGYSVGYEVNVQLRPGERLTRNWANKGLHVNMDGGETPGCLNTPVGKDNLRYTPAYGDLAPGRIGNGTLAYDVPLASGALGGGALVADNLASTAEDKAAPALHVKDAARDAVLILRMASPYVYLTGRLTLKAVVGDGGGIAVALSDNNGLDWKEIAAVAASGDQAVDLKPHVLRRYDYRLRFTMKGKGTGLDALAITHDIQHSQRPLPALAQGANRIAFSAEPQEGTITVEGTTDPANRGKQVFYTDFHPERENIADDYLRLTQGTGHVTFPIETPGDMTRVRVGVYYRARDAKDAWNVQVSFDGGKTFLPVGRCEGPTRNHGKYFVFTQVPAGCRAALVRFAGEQRNTAMIYQARIMADYREPHGGFRPVKVTYVWEEGGAEKRNVHVARKAAETYTIDCPTAPLMKSLVVELAE